MKKIGLIILSALHSITVFGQVDMKEINKSLAKINDNLYASKTELSNSLYSSFLNSLKNANNLEALTIAQIDSLKWREKNSYNEPYVQYYHAHPAYQDYPVVNISYEGAVLFCEWLSNQYNSDPKRKFKKILFRLPTEKEWILAAQGGDKLAIYPWKGTELKNKDGLIMSNFKRDEKDSLTTNDKYFENADITAPVKSYWENNFGLHNMSGNVAEMISEKGIAKGGSWKNEAEFLKIENKYKYDGKASPFIGFRFFAEIIEK